MKIGSQIPVYLIDIFISKKLKEIKRTLILDLILTKKRLVSEIEVERDLSFYSLSILNVCCVPSLWKIGPCHHSFCDTQGTDDGYSQIHYTVFWREISTIQRSKCDFINWDSKRRWLKKWEAQPFSADEGHFFVPPELLKPPFSNLYHIDHIDRQCLCTHLNLYWNFKLQESSVASIMFIFVSQQIRQYLAHNWYMQLPTHTCLTDCKFLNN